jgi:methylated-DNA-protein-cysteine methyltransferase related protein
VPLQIHNKMKTNGIYSKIYAVVRRIPEGRIATYGQIARLAGLPNGARQVGYALHNLGEDSDVPWHRVVNREGRISLPPILPSSSLQKALLESEGVEFNPDGSIPLKKFLWKKNSLGKSPMVVDVYLKGKNL